jgi:hypothetical protein
MRRSVDSPVSLAEVQNGLIFIETSGLEGTNVDLAVQTLVQGQSYCPRLLG